MHGSVNVTRIVRWIFFISLVLLMSRQPARADWPQWRGPGRDGHVPAGVAVPASLPTEPKVLWHFKVGEGLASPTAASGKVFYLDAQNDRETLHAIADVDGKEIWRADIDETFMDGQSAPGPRCTPVVDDGLVFAQSGRGELRCLKVADGSLVWHVSFITNFGAIFIGEKGSSVGAARHGYNAAPIIDGENIYATVGATNGASVVCFEKTTGKVVWKSQNDPAAYAAPIIATFNGVRQLVVFTADGLIGLDLHDGKLLWRVPLKTSSARHVTTPVVLGDTVLVASHEIGLVAVKVSQTGDKWLAEKAWSRKESAINFSSPVLAGEYLYGLGPAKNFICVEVKTGKPMWSQSGYIAGAPDNAHAAFIVMGANILALTDGGQLVLFPADPQAFKELAKTQVCGKTWCNPAYSDGKLYLRDGRELMCIRLLE